MTHRPNSSDVDAGASGSGPAVLTDDEWASVLPKFELHTHLEGTVRPEDSIAMAKRNGIDLPFESVDDMRAAQDYGEPALQNFLAYHYAVFSAIRRVEDVELIARRYVERCAENNIRHVEVHVCLQDYVDHGIDLDELLDTLHESALSATRVGVDVAYIYGINRSLSVASAIAVLKVIDRHPGSVVGVGSCSEETGHPPVMFAEFFAAARDRGLRLTAHCDCDQLNSVEHIRQCVQEIGVERIDHGVNILDAPESLLTEARDRNIHFTVVPTWRPSDPGPRRIERLIDMHDRGLSVSVNTDDPEEFASGHLSKLIAGLLNDGRITRERMIAIMRDTVRASWASVQVKEDALAELQVVEDASASDIVVS